MFRLRNPHRILFQFAESHAISRQTHPTLSFSHATIRFLQLSRTETGQRLTLVTTRREEIEIVLTPTQMLLKFPQAPHVPQPVAIKQPTPRPRPRPAPRAPWQPMWKQAQAATLRAEARSHASIWAEYAKARPSETSTDTTRRTILKTHFTTTQQLLQQEAQRRNQPKPLNQQPSIQQEQRIAQSLVQESRLSQEWEYEQSTHLQPKPKPQTNQWLTQLQQRATQHEFRAQAAAYQTTTQLQSNLFKGSVQRQANAQQRLQQHLQQQQTQRTRTDTERFAQWSTAFQRILRPKRRPRPQPPRPVTKRPKIVATIQPAPKTTPHIQQPTTPTPTRPAQPQPIRPRPTPRPIARPITAKPQPSPARPRPIIRPTIRPKPVRLRPIVRPVARPKPTPRPQRDEGPTPTLLDAFEQLLPTKKRKTGPKQSRTSTTYTFQQIRFTQSMYKDRLLITLHSNGLYTAPYTLKATASQTWTLTLRQTFPGKSFHQQPIDLSLFHTHLQSIRLTTTPPDRIVITLQFDTHIRPTIRSTSNMVSIVFPRPVGRSQR